MGWHFVVVIILLWFTIHRMEMHLQRLVISQYSNYPIVVANFAVIIFGDNTNENTSIVIFFKRATSQFQIEVRVWILLITPSHPIPPHNKVANTKQGYDSIKLLAHPVQQLFETRPVLPSRLALSNQRRVRGKDDTLLDTVVYVGWDLRILELEGNKQVYINFVG